LVTLVTLGLIVASLIDAGVRGWWNNNSLITDTVSGLLVLLITILIVNQLLNIREARQRSTAVAAQTAIMMAQAAQSAGTISSVAGGSGDRNAASDDFRSYTMMLLISAPVFIGDSAARRFLEQAQDLDGAMAHTLALITKSKSGAAVPSDRLDNAMKRLQSAAAPLLQPLSPEVRGSIQRIGRTINDWPRVVSIPSATGETTGDCMDVPSICQAGP
jgi:hypothetical protein